MTEDSALLPLSKAHEPRTERALVGEVIGHSLFRLMAQDVPGFRRRPKPIPRGWECVPPALLRYSDEQTIAGTAAVFAAMDVLGLAPDRFEDWGVVAASRYLGRANLAQALRSFDAEGVWGVSPHLIPHFALHSSSGTISLALGLHGPNLGVGGGLHSAAEGFLAALTWLATGVVPGVWLVLTGWAPELVPDRATGECQALALALVPDGGREGQPRVRVVTESASRRVSRTLDLERLAHRLARPGEPRPRTIATDPTGQIRVELAPGTDEPAGMSQNGHG